MIKHDSLSNKIVAASKWSAITEIMAKLVSPISTVILARILAPEAFGIMVTATMVVSFAEIFTDAGFQKYLIQRDFSTDSRRIDSTNVAFWTNFFFSLVVFLLIACFSNGIANAVGCPGYESVIIVSSINIPIASLSSIQIALYRRKLDFRTLFYIRIVGIFVPLLITVPLAFVTKSYWSLIVGMLALNIINACVLTFFSSWKPKFFYDFSLLREMFGFSSWTMVESITFWLMGYVDIFIVGHVLNQYYLGIYKTAISTVGQFVSIIVSATTPVLFAGLSRVQNDSVAFEQLFFKFQKITSILLVPLAFGLFLYSDIVVSVLLGSQWTDVTYFMGLWAMTSSVAILLSNYSSEIYRAKGKPRLSVLSQCLQIVFLIVTLYYFKESSFDTFCTARALSRFQGIFINLIIISLFVGMSPIKMLKNIVPSFLSVGIASAVVVSLVSWNADAIFFKILSIPVYLVVYLILIRLFPAERACLDMFVSKIIKRKKNV